MSEVSIRPYQAIDEAGVLRTWNRGLYADPINATTWRAKVLLDPNFDREGCMVAEVDGEVQGFILSLVRRVPFFNDGLEPEKSWITAFAVDPAWQRQGIGGRLLDAAVERLRGLGRTTVALAPYVPNYFTPGADVRAYDHGITFLTERGFKIIERPISMRAELTVFTSPQPVRERIAMLREDGIEVRPATPEDIAPVLDFIPRHFSWDWHREATGVFNDLYNGDPRFVGMVVARQHDEVLGYAEHRGERFGPFGVRPDLRSWGIGRALLATTLSEMLKKNFHAAWFLWTGDDAARLYGQLGFHEVRRFAVMRRDLTRQG
ncbi:MAG: GNAT family N-acetyltransferase [Chloroflexota bacterium]|nr:GNAT family N-acetyltransferase [Chloroflexota bacterium]